jgi:hypothetical protein
MYSSALTAYHPTYVPPAHDWSSSYYEAIKVNVLEAGVYNFGSNSSVTQVGYLYKGSFNPLQTYENLLIMSGKRCDQQFTLRIHLQINTTYVLVVILFSRNVTGAFSIIASGPNHVSLNRIGEYLHYFVNNQHKNTEYRICL